MASNHSRIHIRASMVSSIEKEFDEPLADIVIGMREQGCNWSTIAGALDISVRTLRRWRRDMDFAPINQCGIVTENRQRAKFVDDVARRHGYDDFVSMYRDMRLSRKMTVAQMSLHTGICERTITKWTPKNLKGIEIKTEKKVAAAQENLARAREIAYAIKASPWYRDSDQIFRRKPNSGMGD